MIGYAYADAVYEGSILGLGRDGGDWHGGGLHAADEPL